MSYVVKMYGEFSQLDGVIYKRKVEMNKIVELVGVWFAVFMAASRMFAAEASLSVDVASAYVFRGVTFNDGLVVQPGIDIDGFGGLSVGVWGNFDVDDYNGALVDNQFSEIDIYGSYLIPLEFMSLSVGYTEYAYPSGGGDADREIGICSGGCLGGIGFGAGFFYGVDGGIEDSLYIELSVEKAFKLTDAFGFEFGTTFGYVNPDDGEDGFSHYTVSLGINYASLSAGVTYVGQIDDDVLPDVSDGGGYDVEVVGTIGVAVEF